MSAARLTKRVRAAARAPIGAALAFAMLGLPALADPFSTDWAPTSKSQARLVAASPDLAGFEIRLAPGAITYWRDPGDAGLPPTLDFSGSDNVAGVEALFPAPKRIAEADGGQAFGYEGGVVFPLRVRLREPAKPATLRLNVDFAVCEKLCVPAKAHLELTLTSAAGSPYADAIHAAVAAVPRAVAPTAFGALEALGADSWRLCAPRQAGPPRDLFAEPPEGWWIKVKPAQADESRDCFTLTVGDKPKGAALPITLRLTLTGGAGPLETTMEAAAKS